jgi:putative metallohydrolase (TIGR04338 family)
VIRYGVDAPQDTRMYDAEQYARDLNLPGERRFTTLAEIQAYVDELTATPWPTWRTTGSLTVKQQPIHTCVYGSGVIRIPSEPTWFVLAARELVLLHEYAHALTGRYDHEYLFVRAMLDLVSHHLPTALEPLTMALLATGALNP